MKIWQTYQKYLFDGIWHIHTSFTDGKNSIQEYAEIANNLKIPLLAFTEHVRMNLDYNFYKFLEEIYNARKKYDQLIILSGCEVKVLSNGKLDCSNNILDKVDYKLFAFHYFPYSLKTYLFSLKNVLENYSVDAWAHPGLYFIKNVNSKISSIQLKNIFKLMRNNDILLEMNIKYKLPIISWLNEYLKVTNKPVVFGCDIHSIDELIKCWKIKQEFQKHHKRLLSDKIDVTAFMVWFVENYSESAHIMKENPDYQWRFK